jgi:hypothetical protein
MFEGWYWPLMDWAGGWLFMLLGKSANKQIEERTRR